MTRETINKKISSSMKGQKCTGKAFEKGYDSRRHSFTLKDLQKAANSRRISIYEILKGEYPNYRTSKLRIRLIRENIKQHICEKCKSKKWLNKDIPLELHHIDGDNTNHKLKNLELLCPNCHSFTDTYRGRNISN